MRYLLAGITAGALAGIFFFQGVSASEIVPEFYNSLAAADLSINPDSRNTGETFVVTMDGKTLLVDKSGNTVKKVEYKDTLTEFSGNGNFYIQYGKVSTKIELFGINGERYWQKESREKPLMSYNGRLIFLLNGDHSGIRIFDTNGNTIGAGQITGRLCTSVEFSEKNDFGACGFIDGSYHFVNQYGVVINSGNAPAGNAVKGIRISSNGKFGFVHYGNTAKDGVRIVNIADKDFEDSAIDNVHAVKTAMNISDEGYGAIFDNEKVLLFDDDCDLEFKLNVPKKRAGFSTIALENGIYALGYTKNTGESQLVVFRSSGRIFYAKEYPGESFLSSSVKDSIIFLRGSDNLFAYKIQLQAD
jgi:hypothetical protein